MTKQGKIHKKTQNTKLDSSTETNDTTEKGSFTPQF